MTRVVEPAQRLGTVQSVSRAFALLDILVEGEFGLTLSSLAGAARLPRSTVHRLLTTMEAAGYTRFEAATGRWLVGARAASAGRAFTRDRDVVVLGRPAMTALATGIGAPVNLAVACGYDVRFVARAGRGDGGVARPGVRLPMRSTGVGKVMLAFDPSTRTDAAAPRLADVRRLGYAVDDEETARGLRCVAAPVFDERARVVAAVSVSGAASRLRDADIPGVGALVRQSAAAITRGIGGRAADPVEAFASCRAAGLV